MSSNKQFADLLKVASILPALLVMPAMAVERIEVATGEEKSITENMTGLGGFVMGGAALVSGGGVLNVNDGVILQDNSARFGGAIRSNGTLNVGNGVVFDGNKTLEGQDAGGAIYGHGGSAPTDANAITIGDNVVFRNNLSNQKAGALYVQDVQTTIGDNATFDGNSSVANAGVIYNYNVRSDSAAMVIGQNASFTNNRAGTDAGVIANYFGDITIGTGSKFDSNSAGANGGAIYNTGTMVVDSAEFAGNFAGTSGGAIYNDADSIITLAGDNVFSGNTAGGVANDIHNMGTLVIESGTTTIDGGITGTGTLTLNSGATLDVGAAMVDQGEFTINGTLVADIANSQNYADLLSDALGTGTLDLTFLSAGTYDKIGEFTYNVTVNDDIFTVTDGDELVVEMKSANEIAQNTGMATGAASTLVALAGANDETLQAMSASAQALLASGNGDKVESELDKINPEKSSVVHSMTTSVQNTLTNIAAGRMALPAMGRSGGDVVYTGGGVWAHGLYNKSKLNGVFNGYTRGVAAGIDSTINQVFTLGAGYAFHNSDVSLDSRDTDIDSHSIFVYGQYKPTEWYANAILNYTMSDYSESGAALGYGVESDYDVNAFGGQVAMGYDFDSGITPEFALRYLHVDGDSYTNSLGIRHDMDATDYLTAILGTKYGFNYHVSEYLMVRPEVRYAVKYDLMSDRNSATVTMPGINAYTLDVERLGRVGAEFGVGLSMKYKELDLSLNYDIELRENYTSQTGMIKARYNF